MRRFGVALFRAREAQAVKAFVSAFNLSLGNYQARTENDIGISFAIVDGSTLKLNEVLEVDLLSLVQTQRLTKVSSGQVVQVKLRDIDIHDLRLPSGHGLSRVPSRERMGAA
jgi:hypothetical protein